ncbi:DUF2750 domain-containing protein [Staphylococcus casei]|uniref:DUF2750 domain-containing protein n=1 Tax=Staphylococcus TaxID=1279 RepID=UPI000CD0C0BD|nr:DUF2750 domain-containing protein [Staphylococcus casei]PNZ62378.1 DUF2750 domain-containing protein [Staphylococcus casei]PTI76866.1 DUF2750 domain-containing protein [Staphylococcus succinus]WJE87144.1 DUF2750 domain-containing protein [Staphylococcus casei]
MSYKESSFYQDILVNEVFYVATKSKHLIKHEILGKDLVCVWTDKAKAKSFLDKHEIEYSHIKELDVDRFVTYEMEKVFDEGEEILMNPVTHTDGDLIDIYKVADEMMSDLDHIRLKEFVKDVAKDDAVFGLTNKNEKRFILISDDRPDKPQIMPVWSIRNRAEKVRNADFEECEIIEIEGEVFGEWLDTLRDDHKAVAIDLKPGAIGTIVSAQKVIDQLTF